MEPETNQPASAAPQLCRSGCGFYGNSSTDGLCSKCYKDPAVTKNSDSIVADIMTTTSTGNYDKMQSLGKNDTINSDQINEVLNLLTNSSKSSLRLKNHNIDLGGSISPFYSNDKSSLLQLNKDISSISESNDELSSPNMDNNNTDHLVKSQSTSSSNISFNSEKLGIDKFDILGSNPEIKSSTSPIVSPPALINVINSHETSSNPDDHKIDMDTSETSLTSHSLGNSPTLSTHKSKPNRCHFCRKKIGISGFPCRCGASFCSIHRYSDKHNCTFDYKELAQSEIRKNNPIVQAQKIQKI